MAQAHSHPFPFSPFSEELFERLEPSEIVKLKINQIY